jgi:hypothetical protein
MVYRWPDGNWGREVLSLGTRDGRTGEEGPESGQIEFISESQWQIT